MTNCHESCVIFKLVGHKQFRIVNSESSKVQKKSVEKLVQNELEKKY